MRKGNLFSSWLVRRKGSHPCVKGTFGANTNWENRGWMMDPSPPSITAGTANHHSHLSITAHHRPSIRPGMCHCWLIVGQYATDGVRHDYGRAVQVYYGWSANDPLPIPCPEHNQHHEHFISKASIARCDDAYEKKGVQVPPLLQRGRRRRRVGAVRASEGRS